MEDAKSISIEDTRKTEYEVRETVEVCINTKENLWVLAVFLSEDEEKEKFSVQILNQDDIKVVEGSLIRKFKGCDDKKMFMNMITLCMGSGIFTLPWAMAGTSVIPGLILIFLSMLYVFYTCKQILEVTDRYNYDNMGQILERELENYPILSKCFFILATATCWISTILCIIAYYILIVDNGQAVIPKLDSFYWYIIGPALASALTFLPNHMLSWTSFVSLLVTLMVIIALIVSLAQNGAKSHGSDGGVHIFSIGRGYFCLISNMMMAMSIQYNIPALYKEVQIRDVKQTTKIMAYAFGAAYVIFSIVGVLGYYRFGSKIEENFFKSLENSVIAIIVKAAAMVVCVCVAPLCILPITVDIENWMKIYMLKRNHAESINEDKENESLGHGFEVVMQIIKVVAMASPVLLSYICKELLNLELGSVNLYNGVSVLLCYCAVTPLVITPKIQIKDYILSGFAVVICGLSIAYAENFYTDLDDMTPNF